MADPKPCSHEFCSNCDRFGAWYRLTGDRQEALTKANDLCLEQTVEFPADLVPEGFIKDHVIGQIAEFGPDPSAPGEASRALITFLNDDTGFELTQVLNVLYGNISLKKGFRLDLIKDCRNFWNRFKGPRFGREGLRKLLGAPARPLLASALKPMGLSATELAEMAGHFAAGGIDIVKDDHGLANQSFAAFSERVERCVEAVRVGAKKAGKPALYAPNVTAPAGELERRARFAKDKGAGALLICPGLTGMDSMRELADDDSVDLPILAHPAFLGSFVTSPDNGISHFALFGQLMRMAGADASIFPHSGGRFGFSTEECRRITMGAAMPMGKLKPIFPMPGGGMNLKRVPELVEFYGGEVIFLVGGDLVRQSPDIEGNCKLFRETIDSNFKILAAMKKK